MSTLPRVSGREVVKALRKAAYEQDRQRGSHIILRQLAYPHRRITVPDHKEIAKGTLRAIIREAGLTVEELKLCCDWQISTSKTEVRDGQDQSRRVASNHVDNRDDRRCGVV